MSDIPPDMTLEEAWSLLQSLNEQLLTKDKEIATLWKKLEESNVELLESLKEENATLKAEVERLHATSGAAERVDAPSTSSPLPDLPDLDAPPAPALEELPPLEEPDASPSTIKPVAAEQPAGLAGSRISAFFNQSVSDKIAFIDEGFHVLQTIASSNHSGEEIGLNLDAFKEKLKALIGFSPSLFPMTSLARNLKKMKDPVDAAMINDLKENLQRWKGEVIEQANK